VTFESEFAPCGGLAAVMREQPKRIAEHEACVTVAPFFRNITGRRPVYEEIASTGHTFRVDWGGQAHSVSVALTIQEEPALTSVACVLTLHNPYDRGLTDAELRKTYAGRAPGTTVLSRAIPFLPGPLTTVSESVTIFILFPANPSEKKALDKTRFWGYTYRHET
jgi:hypothetical protein